MKDSNNRKQRNEFERLTDKLKIFKNKDEGYLEYNNFDDTSNRRESGGRNFMFSYNTQYGVGFKNFKNTKLSQYHQFYSKIDSQDSGNNNENSFQEGAKSRVLKQISGFSKVPPKYNK